MKFTFFIILSLFSFTFSTQETKIINLKNVSAYQAARIIKAAYSQNVDVWPHENFSSENMLKIIGDDKEIERVQKFIDRMDSETQRIQTCKFICE
ncbi:hypothetical protein M1446_05640 [Candidatus Dependentiae bacterium]|nr:hypothetical protein [Candidatus Dependentiae bacterium]